jgi:hypothetical protein
MAFRETTSAVRLAVTTLEPPGDQPFRLFVTDLLKTTYIGGFLLSKLATPK